MELELSKTCCRKAFLLGLFFGAQTEQNNRIMAEFRSEEIAKAALEILKRQFSSEPELIKVGRAGRYFWRVEATTKALCSFLQTADKKGGEAQLSSLAGFRCAACPNSFLRGVFLAVGSINDPDKGYHLELSLPNGKRAELISNFLSEAVSEPKRVERGGKTGLYYKRNMQIVDMLYYVGAMQCGFDFSNSCISKDIRNNINRTTNCVAKNISRAVDASLKHIEAIELLEKFERMPNLSEELRYTAELRVANPSVSLAELARLHEPPISKSGLNRRLLRIMEEAEDVKK